MKTFREESCGLLTDLYEITMAYGYWKANIADRLASFQLFFRKKPFHGEYAIAAGLGTLIEYLARFRFEPSDLTYLESLKDQQGNAIFEKGFLDYLEKFSFVCDVDAIPEGTLVFPHEPLLRVTGPILQAQLLESLALNVINFQTLIATKASRVCFAAGSDPVVEFGLRRAQGVDGAMSASRASFIGGCQATSNVLAGKEFDIPVKGTHAHSWIMAFDQEKEAFEVYAKALPDQCVFLIDTYNSIEGTKCAIEVAKNMRKRGKEILGVRLDSGDLAALSIRIRKMLDEEGFPHAKIMASNELDEFLIRDLKHQGAQIDIWGVGTNLVTGKEQPALDGVYKLSALCDREGKWNYKIKISDQILKVTNPGILQVRRFFDQNGWISDMIYDTHLGCEEAVCIDMQDPTSERIIKSHMAYEDLLVPILRKGSLVYKTPTLAEIQQRTHDQLENLPLPCRRFLNPQPYYVGMEKKLYQLKKSLIQKVKSPS